ncbi:hypothetical protein ALC53_03211 [Atta colombica]|uniref:Uncharacterized protein n=1 Tax=Atta colombica TaxID=520822 RepID=A0A151I5H2_9HYME|nr:hypothetical protein ALC53_03211 [Atta colombica]
MDTKNFNRGTRKWNRIKRNVKKLNTGYNNNEEPTISKDDLEGFRYRALLVDHLAIDFKSVFKAEQVVKISK